MTIFQQRRSAPKPQSTEPPPSSKPRANHRMDDYLFDDINWPEDDELESCEIENRGLSISSNRGSELDLCRNASRWVAQGSSDHSSTPSATSGDNCGEEENAEQCPSGRIGSGGCRFSKEARSILRTWYHEHRENPYPTSEEKDELVNMSGLKRSQISLWLANTRRKNRARANQKQAAGAPTKQRSFGEMNPLDRWKVTPIELEAVSPPVILAVCEDNQLKLFDPIDEEFDYYPSALFGPEQASSKPNNYDAARSITTFSHNDSYFAQSMASYETGLTSTLGGSSLSDQTSFSYSSLKLPYSHISAGDRRRRRVNPSKPPKPTAKAKARPFQCTFCPDSTFATKHDWQRHEKSQHLSLETWVCCLSGGIIDSAISPLCAFCDLPNPTKQHLETHNFSACQMKEPSERTFYRKDHFQQHLRLTHECKINARMEAWKSEVGNVRSRCGFCSATFTTWSGRAEHLASHFKCRATMKDWVGDWGFEPHVAALVENAPSAALLLEPLGSFHSTPKISAFDASHMPPPPLFTDMPVVDMSTNNYQFGATGSYAAPLIDFNTNVHLANTAMTFPDTGMMGYDATDAVDWAQFAP
ncbi:hypothetical protein V501_05603 [Pseudogymnoascus sp. VKM F-4519 (FW-2642)]|nr:hypothetical protein V501_05603 [Pseudogymnoascus sp. VKM F-4519 (FW-2642)]